MLPLLVFTFSTASQLYTALASFLPPPDSLATHSGVNMHRPLVDNDANPRQQSSLIPTRVSSNKLHTVTPVNTRGRNRRIPLAITSNGSPHPIVRASPTTKSTMSPPAYSRIPRKSQTPTSLTKVQKTFTGTTSPRALPKSRGGGRSQIASPQSQAVSVAMPSSYYYSILIFL